MRVVSIAGLAGLMLLGACHGKPVTPPANQNAEANAADDVPAPENASADVDLKAWLVGSWSFENTCATDFIVHYAADGALDNSGHTGTWKIDANGQVTETVTQRPVEGGEGLEKVDPPEINVYSVSRVDQSHGTIAFRGRSVPLLRC